MDDRMHSQLDLYLRKCSELGLKPNSMLVKQLGRNASQPPCLSVYDFRRNYLGDRGVIPLADALGLDRGMRSLNLSNNGIRNRGTLALVDILAQHPGITQVDLSRNIISKTGGLALVKLLHKNPRVTAVDVQSTRIEDAITSQIRTALQTNQKRCTLETSKLQGATDQPRAVPAPPLDHPVPACPPRAPSAPSLVPTATEPEPVAAPAAKVEPQAASRAAQAGKADDGEAERAGAEKRVPRTNSKVKGVVLDTDVLGVSSGNPFQSGDLESKPVLPPEAAFAKAAARLFTLSDDVAAPNPFQTGELLPVPEDIDNAVEHAKVRRLDALADVDLPNPFQTAEIASQPDLPIEHAMHALDLLPTPAPPDLQPEVACVPQPDSAPPSVVGHGAVEDKQALVHTAAVDGAPVEQAGDVITEPDRALTAPQECGVAQVAAGGEKIEREAATKAARVLVVGEEVPNPWQTGEQAAAVEDLDAEVDKYQSRRIPLAMMEGVELSNPFQTGDLLAEPDKPVDAIIADPEEAARHSGLAGEAEADGRNLRRVTLAGGLELGNPFQSGEVSTAPEPALDVVAVKAAARVLTLSDDVQMQNPFQSAQVAEEPDKPIDAVLDKLASRQVTLSDGLDVANPFQTADIALEPDAPIDTVLEHMSQNGQVAPPTDGVAVTDTDAALADLAAHDAEPRAAHAIPNDTETPEPAAHHDDTCPIAVVGAAAVPDPSSDIAPVPHHDQQPAHQPPASDARDADEDVSNIAAGGVSAPSEGGAAGHRSGEAVAQGAVADVGLDFGVEAVSGLESTAAAEAQEAPGTPVYKDVVLEPASPASIQPHHSNPQHQPDDLTPQHPLPAPEATATELHDVALPAEDAAAVAQVFEAGAKSSTHMADVQQPIEAPSESSQPAVPAVHPGPTSDLLSESHNDTHPETGAAQKDEHEADGAGDSAHGQELAAGSRGTVVGVTESLEDVVPAPSHAALPDVTHHDAVSDVVNHDHSAQGAEAARGVAGVNVGEVTAVDGSSAVPVMEKEPDAESRRASSAFTFAVQAPAEDVASADASGPTEPSQGLSGRSVVDKAREVLGSSALQGSLYAAKNFDLILTPATPFEADPHDLDAPKQRTTDQDAVDAAPSEPVAPSADGTAVDSRPLSSDGVVEDMPLVDVSPQHLDAVIQEHTAAPPAQPIAQAVEHETASSDVARTMNDETDPQRSASVGVVHSDAPVPWIEEAQAAAAAAPAVDASPEVAGSAAAPSSEALFAVDEEQGLSSMPIDDMAHLNHHNYATQQADPPSSAPDAARHTNQDDNQTAAPAESSAARHSHGQDMHHPSHDGPTVENTTNGGSEDMHTLHAMPSLPSAVDGGDMTTLSTGQDVEHDEMARIGSGADADAARHEDAGLGSGNGESRAAQVAGDAAPAPPEAPVAIVSAADMSEEDVALGAAIFEDEAVETAMTATTIAASAADAVEDHNARPPVDDHLQASHRDDAQPYVPEQQPGHALVTEPAETPVGLQSDQVPDDDAGGQGQSDDGRDAWPSQMREIEELIITQVEQQLGVTQAEASHQPSSNEIAAQVINEPDDVECIREPDAVTQDGGACSERVDSAVLDSGVPSHATEVAPEEPALSPIEIEPAPQTELQLHQPSTHATHAPPQYTASTDSHDTIEQAAPLETLPIPDVPMASGTAEAAVVDPSDQAVAGTLDEQHQDTPLRAHESADAGERSVADGAGLQGHAFAAVQDSIVDSHAAHRSATPDDLDTRLDFCPPMPQAPSHQPPDFSAPSHPEPAAPVPTETDDRSVSAGPSAEYALPAAATEGVSTPALASSFEPEAAFVPTGMDDASVSAGPSAEEALPGAASEEVSSCAVESGDIQGESTVEAAQPSSLALQNTEVSAAAIHDEPDTQVAHITSMQSTDNQISSDETTAGEQPGLQQLVFVPVEDCSSDSNPQADNRTALIHNDGSVGEEAAPPAVAAHGDVHSESQADMALRDTEDAQQQVHDAPMPLHTAAYTADCTQSEHVEPSYALSSAPPDPVTNDLVVAEHDAAAPVQVEDVSETASHLQHMEPALPDADNATSENPALPPEATDSTEADGSADFVEVS